MSASDLIAAIILFVCFVVFVVCAIGMVTGASPAEMLPIQRRRYWLRRYVESQIDDLGREPTRGDIAHAIEMFEIDPRERIRTMKRNVRRYRLTEELLPTSARIAELEDEIDPKPKPRSLGRSSRPWEVYPDGWRHR